MPVKISAFPQIASLQFCHNQKKHLYWGNQLPGWDLSFPVKPAIAAPHICSCTFGAGHCGNAPFAIQFITDCFPKCSGICALHGQYNQAIPVISGSTVFCKLNLLKTIIVHIMRVTDIVNCTTTVLILRGNAANRPGCSAFKTLRA